MIQKTVLENGLTVLTAENSAADIIACRIFLKAGSRYEPLEKAGLSHLLATVITKGTEQLSSAEIAERVESIGAALGADAATDYFLLSFKTVSADFMDMLALTGEILRSPTFPQNEVELERYLTLQNIRAQQEQPFNVAFDKLRRVMYPNHPYGVSILGSLETASELTREDLQAYHSTYFRPDNIIISLCGRVNQETAIVAIKEVFGDWQIPSTPIPSLQIPTLLHQPSREILPQETQQSIVMLGYLTPSVQDADYATLKLLNTYLGNGLSSRLFVELREKRGLAYDVSAFYPTRLYQSQFIVYMGTAPENTTIAIEGLQREVERLCETLLSDEELQAAKNKLLGQYALGKQTNAEIAQVYGWYEVLGLGLEFDLKFQETANAVTPEKALQVASRYFSEPYLSVVGPAAILEGQLIAG